MLDVVSEIFPNHLRNSGQSFGYLSVHWVVATQLSFFGTSFICQYRAWYLPFSIFAGFMVLQLMFVHFMMPETEFLLELSKVVS